MVPFSYHKSHRRYISLAFLLFILMSGTLYLTLFSISTTASIPLTPAAHNDTSVITSNNPTEGQREHPLSFVTTTTPTTTTTTTTTSRLASLRERQNRKPLNLIYLTSPVPYQYGGQISEALWIRDTVLSKLQRPVITHVISEKEKHTFYMNDSLIVCLFLKRTLYLEAARAAGVKNIGVYWMGDEKYEHDRSFIPLADYVFRNYYHAEMLRQYSNLYWLPNGVKSGLGCSGWVPNTLPLASQRRYLCSFLGSIRANRKDLLDYLSSHDIHCVTFVNSWEDHTTKHPILYRFQYLEHTQFTLCPYGNNAETMRHYEALEHGSIPIIFKHKNSNLDVLTAWECYGGPNVTTAAAAAAAGVTTKTKTENTNTDNHLLPAPSSCRLPVFQSFAEVVEFLQYYSSHRHDEELDTLQNDILGWWLWRKDQIMTKARDVIERSFFNRYGPSL